LSGLRAYVIIFHASPRNAQDIGTQFHHLAGREIVDDFTIYGLTEISLDRLMEVLA